MARSSAPAGGSPSGAARDRHRVMVVDDSAVIRGLIARILEADSDLEVVSSVGNGEMALAALRRAPVDVIVLDIEMPVMDGLTALPKLIAASPGTQIIMASTLTKENAEVSLKAMQMGAADYVAKPSAMREIHGAGAFKQELVAKVRTLAAAARRAGVPRPAATPQARPVPRPASGPTRIALRETPANFRPDVIAIGSSTGGPQALFELLGHLAGQVRLPIVVTQHMPATFTTILAEHIGRQCRIPAMEGRDGEVLAPGRCYIAPGNFHMTVEGRGGGVIRLNQDPPENFCRPSVDVMLRSVVRAYGRNVLTVILTGMGQDGLKGCQALVEAGGAVLAQDEATSVVWGMPGAVAAAGLCSAVLPIKEIGPAIRKMLVRAAA